VRADERAEGDRLIALCFTALACVTPIAWIPPYDWSINTPASIALPKSEPVPLLTTDNDNPLVHLDFLFGFTVRAMPQRTFRAIATGYSYRILDEDERELLAFQWHPSQRASDIDSGRPTFPHVHVRMPVRPRRDGEPEGPTLRKVHIPTGFTSIADVVRMLITDFHVEPITNAWENDLDECQTDLAHCFPIQR
jgi:hypothetical protein